MIPLTHEDKLKNLNIRLSLYELKLISFSFEYLLYHSVESNEVEDYLIDFKKRLDHTIGCLEEGYIDV